MEAQAIAASLQRSREQIRAELLETGDDQDRLSGLEPRSAVMSFLLAPQRRGMVMNILEAVLSLTGRGKGSGSGMGRLLWFLLALSLRRR